MSKFELYVDGQLFGIYSTNHDAARDAFEILIDGNQWTFEIVEIPAVPTENHLAS
jgi:hypothetical protein